MKKEKVIRKGTLHFTIDGTWFTWILRHLWIEGNQMKAVKMWIAAFPELSSPKILQTVFLDLVAGRKKFTGNSDGPNGFGYEDDGTKYWSSVAGGEPDKGWPLLDSWEDVMKLKKAQLFLKELELRSFRLKRQYPDNYIDCNFNAMTWDNGAAENRVENNIRKQINELYTDTRNLSYQLLVDIELEQLPDESALLRAGSAFDKGRTSSRDIDKKIQRNNLTAFEQVKERLDAVKEYFEKKYGQCIFHYNSEELESMYSFESKVFTVEETEKSLSKTRDYDRNLTKNLLQNASLMMGIKIPDVDTYVKSLIEESHREKIVAEDAKSTQYTSGYIDPKGNFYGCTDLLHSQFSETLCEQFGINQVRLSSNPLTRASKLDEAPNAENALDLDGWIKISMNRFFWLETVTPTQSQITTIFDYMLGKNLDHAMFNTSIPSEAKTFAEQFQGAE